MTHPIATAYSSPEAIERILILIATILHHPGIGGRDPLLEAPGNHNAIAPLQQQMTEMAQTLNLDLPEYSSHTLRKDLKLLRQYGLLDHRMYRWGYYLGNAALNRTELTLALNALAAQAQQQGHPVIRRVYTILERRLKGANLESGGQLLYPVRTQLSRMIMPTDPEAMMAKRQYRRTLFHHIDKLEDAIATGTAVQLTRHHDPYGTMTVGDITVYPLQLMASDIAWYLLYEYAPLGQTTNPTPPPPGHFEIERVDRFSDQLTILAQTSRGTPTQYCQLQQAHHLRTKGWGLYLGDPHHQHQERQGIVPLVSVTARFFAPIQAFILEGELRHPTQTLSLGHDGCESFVDYQVKLPERSLNEFLRWTYRFTGFVKLLEPDCLAQQHRQTIQKAMDRY
ncbi:MAG: WYL domain-containing protein [Leptolyngbyaceae bacterium]|nr:WYL domain-containing protein [Leptolyngbyaceae bacterium]